MNICIIGASGNLTAVLDALRGEKRDRVVAVAPGSLGEDMADVLSACQGTGFRPEPAPQYRAMLDQFTELGIWTGWLAFFIFIPLALTSNDISVRTLGPSWKSLHRFVYAAAVATLVHWIFINNTLGPALARFVPLALLEGYRIWRTLNPADERLERG